MTEIVDPGAVSTALYSSADLHGEIAQGIESRNAYITTLKLLCLYVAGADGELTGPELDMMQTIFAGEDIDEVWANDFLSEMNNDPSFVEDFLATAESIMRRKWLSFIQLDLPYRSEHETLPQLISIICKTVVAADDNVDEREFERLSDVTYRLREYAEALVHERFGA